MLQDESICNLYQHRLTQLLKEIPTDIDINKEWDNIKGAINQIANEVLGTKLRKERKRGLRIWTNKIEEAVNGKEKHSECTSKKTQRKQDSGIMQ